MSPPLITEDAIAATEKLIRPWVRRTPVIELNASDFGLDAGNLNLKLEFLQYAGSFKARGAFANLLNRKVPSVGVTAASGGNHGLAVAFASHKLNLPAKIFVPSVAAQTKVDRIRSYGADLVITGERYADALATSQEWSRQSGAMMIHAYDDVHTLLGQGSVAVELESQVPEMDTLFVSVGGGGLIGGIAAWYRGRIRVIGVEPEAAPTLTAALAAGRPIDAPAGGVAADSLAPRRVGELMFPIAQQSVARVVLVTDKAIQAAQQQLWDTLRIASEPGGAAALAALLSGQYQPAPGERVGVLICGANTDAVSYKDRV
jgi:threonine dehydratase